MPIIEKTLIRYLSGGPTRTADMVQNIATSLSVSPQGVYKALRNMYKEEIASHYRGTSTLSEVWLQKEKEGLDFAIHALHSSGEVVRLIQKTTGTFSCKFKTLNETDLFWTNTFSLCTENTPKEDPAYSIQPHDRYPALRPETDRYWLKHQLSEKRVSRVILTHPDTFDRSIVQKRKKVLGTLFEFLLNKNPLKQKETVHRTIVGDYIFTVIFDAKVTQSLDALLREQVFPLSKDTANIARVLAHTNGSFLFSIEKNKEKAERLRKRVRNYFE